MPNFILSFLKSHALDRVFGLIVLGLMSRLMPHPPNFTAIHAIALFGLSSLGGLGISFFTVFTMMFLGDCLFGFHSGMIFVYSSFGLIVLMGYFLKIKKSFILTGVLLVTSSLLFFIITNFGVWVMSSVYPKTVIGLELCYLAALPFLISNIMGTLFYGALLYPSELKNWVWAEAKALAIRLLKSPRNYTQVS